MSLLNQQNKAFGLDFSDGSLRLAQLSVAGKKIRLERFNEISLPEGCIENGEIRRPDELAGKIKDLLKGGFGSKKLHRQVIACLPEAKTFLKTISLPETAVWNDQSATDLIARELPWDISDIYFDWQLMKNKQRRQIIIGATPKKIADAYLQALSSAGLIPVALEIEAAAISRLLIERDKQDSPQMIIDLGASRTGLFYFSAGAIQFALSLPFSGRELTDLISTSLDLSAQQSEQAKLVCGLDKGKCQGAVAFVLDEAMDKLAESITQAIKFAADNYPADGTISNIILCGGGANFAGLADVITAKTKLPTLLSDPLRNIACASAEMTPDKAQSYATAIGLALRGLNTNDYL